MMDSEGQPAVDTTVPSPARIYDYALGGAQNFAVDRAVLDQITEIFPSTPQPARDNRDFLRRAVRFCGERGIGRFLDLGSGIPTVDNVHEVAQKRDPAARVVYVDNDPVAAAHAYRLLGGVHGATMLQQDMRDTEQILAQPEVRSLLDDQEPVAVLMVAMAHYLKDADDPIKILSAYREAMPPGSYLVFSHMTGDDFPEQLAQAVETFNADASDNDQMVLRSHAEQQELLEASGFALVDPGLTYPACWRPQTTLNVDHDPRNATFYAAVAHPRRHNPAV
ncbi:SAM-dependent methyltransferase [Saccharopolyspora griseoalba]|uniref:SAM-dependent methyltransferase n=1 Tax=Saccharopolyspora griseoalba TaxID=1431848 RepID=A0ABW2LTR5_9PSEU